MHAGFHGRYGGATVDGQASIVRSSFLAARATAADGNGEKRGRDGREGEEESAEQNRRHLSFLALESFQKEAPNQKKKQKIDNQFHRAQVGPRAMNRWTVLTDLPTPFRTFALQIDPLRGAIDSKPQPPSLAGRSATPRIISTTVGASLCEKLTLGNRS